MLRDASRWTTVRPTPDQEIQPDGIVSWSANFDQDSFWFQYIIRKFSAALYRNRFRREESSDWKDLLSSSKSKSKISPSSFQILSHTRKHHCIRSHQDKNSSASLCGPRTLSPTSTVVGLNDAHLSLWMEGLQCDWTPWNTFTELGGQALAAYNDDNTLSMAHYDQIIAKIDSLSENIYSANRPPVDLILSGDSWTELTRNAFEGRLRSNGKPPNIEIKDVVYQPDIYAASKRSARWGRYGLDTYALCYMLDDNGDIAHDEL